MSGIDLQLDDYPLVRVRFPESLTLADIDALAAKLRPLYERGEKQPFVSLVDVRQLSSHGTEERRHLAALMNALGEQFPGAKKGEAVITASRVVQGMYMALNWLRSPPSYAQKVFTDPAAAEAWSKKLLAGSAAE